MFQLDPIHSEIKEKLEEISCILMHHENKDYCLAKVHPSKWQQLHLSDNKASFFIVPSPAYDKFIICREYLKVVDEFPKLFGTGNDWDIVHAIKEYDRERLVRKYTDKEYFDYIRGETMAYVFKVKDNGTLSDKILRLDLCRNINDDNIFQGGIFHAFKHFTPNNYNTISSNHGEFIVESFHVIYEHIILNFFSDDFNDDPGKKNCYIARSHLKDGHVLRGVYYKENDIPVSFINSIRIEQPK